MALSLNLSSQSLQYQIGGTPPLAENVIIDFGGLLSEQYTYEQVRLKYYINMENSLPI